MIQTKAELMNMKPDDTLLLPVTNPTNGSGILDLRTNLNYLTMTFPEESNMPGVYALMLSGKPEVKLFHQMGLNLGAKFYFRPVLIRDLFAMLMVNHTNLLLDPFNDDLVVLTPHDMYTYCQEHQEEIYKDQTFNSPAYTNFRVKMAKEDTKEKERLLKDLVANGVFFVVSTPAATLNPCVSQIGKVDQRKHLMLFTSDKLALRFCQHSNLNRGGARGLPLVPVRVTLDQLRVLDPRHTGAEMLYLNDGAEGIAFAYRELPL